MRNVLIVGWFNAYLKHTDINSYLDVNRIHSGYVLKDNTAKRVVYINETRL